MDDELSALLNLHNSFGLPHDTTPQDLTPPNNTCHETDITTTLADSKHGEGVPDIISDHGTPNSVMSSLITPTDPLFGMFRSLSSRTPFPSEDWFPPHPTNLASTPFAYPNPPSLPLHASPYPHQPTWGPIPPASARFANHSPLAVTMPHTTAQYEVPVPTLPDPTFPGMFDPLLYGLNNPALSSCEGKNPTSNGKDGATTGPKRIERSRKRRAPYPVNKGHEGVQNPKMISQQASLSETPGYGDVNAPKCSTKSRSNKKAHESPNQPIASSSIGVDRPAAADSGIHIPQRTAHILITRPIIISEETPADTPPEAKGIRAIRSHARSKKPGVSKVKCAFVNVSCKDFREQADLL